MIVTIIADASFCNETSACGWGFAIISDRGRYTSGGSSKYVVGTSTEAEISALVDAILVAYERDLLQKGDHLILQTDCQGAIDAILGIASKKNRLSEYGKKLAERVRILLDSLTLHKYELRHVPGHTNGSTPRTFVNNKVDSIARMNMRKARNEIRTSLKTA